MQPQMNRDILVTLALMLVGTVTPAMPSIAQDVGTAAAVNKLSEGTPPRGETQVLQIGSRVVHNERIQTSASGTVQLLFIDKTTLSIGPNSSLVIDDFAYDPTTGAGQIVTSLSKGALRFVGGELSHRDAATVKTPVATVGIRGGTATIAYGQEGARLINHSGQVRSTNACGTAVIRRAGFALTIADKSSCATEPERVSQSEINQYLVLLTSKPGQKGGAASAPTAALMERYGIGQVNGNLGLDTQPVQQQTTRAENVSFDLIVQATQKGAPRINPQVPTRTSPRPPPPPPPSLPRY